MEKKFFLFIVFFIRINSQIKENPIFLVNASNPFVLSTNDDYYYVITAGRSLKINKEFGNIENITINNFTNSNYIYIVDNIYNNYIYYSNKYYHIIYSPFISYEEITVHSEQKNGEQNPMIIVGSIPKDNDFIVYGITKIDYLSFSSKSQYYCASTSFEKEDIDERLSCKLIENNDYICGIITEENLSINCFKYQIFNNSLDDSLTLYRNTLSWSFSSISSFGLYDIDKNRTNIKLFCRQRINQNNLICDIYECTCGVSDCRVNFLNHISLSAFDAFSEKNCYCSQFNLEYLFCCGIIDYIKCFRINTTNYQVIKEFNIQLQGNNSYLTIKNNIDYITLFFMNSHGDGDSVYEYYIYLPTCQNKNYEIFYHITENKTKEELDKLRNLSEVKSNKYFFEFKNQSDDFGYFILNNETLFNKTQIYNNDYILEFLIINNNQSTSFTKVIDYIVSVEDEEAYKAECQILITFKMCYYSCEKCYLDINDSNDTHHNCIKCRDNYYPSPENKTNCYSIEEKQINWYFDSNLEGFGICNEECLSCSGPTKFNCLSCNNGSYLDNNTCTSNCSEGYLPIKIDINSSYYFICNECYKNCKTCFNIGNAEKMNCETCKDNQIKYNDSCYDINDSLNKSFYVQVNNSLYVTNCFEKFGLYIKENSHECIPFPKEEEGYYISNNATGLLSKCHNNCFSCNNGPIKDYYGNIQSMECIKCKDSNSSQKTMIKMENNCFLIIEYELEKIIFNVSEKIPDKHFATCLDFGKVINYGEYECIEKKNNTYHVLNDSIESDNYNKTEESNNNYERNYSIISNNGVCSFGTNNKEESLSKLREIIKQNDTQIINSCIYFNESNFFISVISSDKINPEEQVKKGISSFDMGNCTNVMKEYYNISNGENLVILNIETKKNEISGYETNSNEDKSFNLGKSTKLEIYDYSGRELNLSVCKEKIKIIKYIGDVEEIDLDSAKVLSDKGIDVFNAKDKFFNDICHPFDNPYEKDIILNDRRNDIYQNITFCQEGCFYNGINYNLKSVDCLCNSNFLQSEKNNITFTTKESNVINFDSLTKSFVENLLSFNFDVIKCYKLILNKQNYFHNFGFLCLCLIFVLQIILFIIYLRKKIKPLKYFMLSFKIGRHNIDNINAIIHNKRKSVNINNTKKIKKYKKKFILNSPPKKNGFETKSSNKNFDIGNVKRASDKSLINKKDYKDNIIMKREEKDNESEQQKLNLLNLLKSKRKSRNNIFISNNFSSTINIKSPNQNIDNSIKKGIIHSESKLKNLLYDEDSTFSQRKSFFKYSKKKIKDIVNMETLSKKKEKKGRGLRRRSSGMSTLISSHGSAKNIIQLSKTDSDIQDLNYEEAIIYDKRSYLKMYWSFLIESQIILGTFFTDNNFDLFVIKLSFLVFTFQISFFLNAFFYTDEYISNAYHNDGVLDFFSGLPKSIYSFIATLIITNILSMLSSSKDELMRVVRNNKQYNNYESIVNNKLKKLGNKLIIYFILIFLLELFFLYYVTVFCIVYKFSQKYWFYGCLESFGMDSLVALIICIFLALFRYISIKNHIKSLYILSKIVSSFL